MQSFKNRAEAGRKLAERLESLAGQPDVIVLGLPRGGVPVAFEVAQALEAPLDVWLVRKLGVPGHEELALGAIASGGARFINQEVVDIAGVSEETIAEIESQKRAELQHRAEKYRGERPEVQVKGRQVILVDDGLATGATMHAAVRALRSREPARLIVAVPAASPQTCAEFEDEVDQIICDRTPEPFMGVGAWYQEFPQTTDEEVQDLLARANQPTPERNRKEQ